MDDNARRVERIKKALGCKTDAELAERIQSHRPNVTRWKTRGFYPVQANLVDALLDELDAKDK